MEGKKQTEAFSIILYENKLSDDCPMSKSMLL